LRQHGVIGNKGEEFVMFKLHPQLHVDTKEVARWDLCRVLLMNDRNYPWLVLVPQRPNVTEMHQLKPEDRAQLMEEIAQAAQFLEAMTQADKINVAALGNVVPQLHIHIIARFETDLAWPRPIWGVLPVDPYTDDEMTETLSYMKAHLRPPAGDGA